MTEHGQHCLRILIEIAVPHFAGLPPQRRADAYEAVSIVAATVDPEVSAKAAKLAGHLRDAEILQGEFIHLMSNLKEVEQ